MIEFLGSQVIPEAATAAGFAAGIIVERLAVNKAAQERQSLVEVWGLDSESEPVVEQTPSRFSQLARKAGRTITPLSVAMGVAAGLTAEAWLPLKEHESQQTPSALEIVVDRSGATILHLNGTPPMVEINKILEQFGGVKHIKPEAIVASAGEIEENLTVKEAQGRSGFGEAHLDQAVKSALSHVRQSNQEATTHNGKRSAGILVLTNGNDIGDPSDIASKARSNGDVPVFVVNVEGDSNNSTTRSLRSIAVRTNAKYWDAQANNVQSVAQDVLQTISPAIHESTQPLANKGTRDFLKILSALSILGVAAGFKHRRKTPFQRNFRGE